jgi:hypothetical protein
MNITKYFDLPTEICLIIEEFYYHDKKIVEKYTDELRTYFAHDVFEQQIRKSIKIEEEKLHKLWSQDNVDLDLSDYFTNSIVKLHKLIRYFDYEEFMSSGKFTSPGVIVWNNEKINMMIRDYKN